MADRRRRRLDVRKTYKLYIGGKFPRSESGRVYPALDTARDAAGPGRPGLAQGPARRGGRSPQGLRRLVVGHGLQPRAGAVPGGRDAGRPSGAVRRRGLAAEGVSSRAAAAIVDDSVDRWVWYAGWADKYAQIAGSTNPVSGPYFSFSLPEPTGVVGVFAPQASSLLGLVSVLAPVLATGNTAVVVCSQDRPLPAVSLAEVLATSDVPGGVVNLLTGLTAEFAPWLAAHRDVNALDLTGVAPEARADLQRAAADTVKRVHIPASGAAGPDWSARPRSGPVGRLRRDEDGLAPDRCVIARAVAQG